MSQLKPKLLIVEDDPDVLSDTLVSREWRRHDHHLAVIQLVPAPIVRPLLQFGEGDALIRCPHKPHDTSSLPEVYRAAKRCFSQ